MVRDIPEEISGEIHEISILLESLYLTGADSIEWLKTKSPAFDGLSPLEFIGRHPEQAIFVRRYLERILESTPRAS